MKNMKITIRKYNNKNFTIKKNPSDFDQLILMYGIKCRKGERIRGIE